MLTEEQKQRRRDRRRERYANDPEFRKKQKASALKWQKENPVDRSEYFKEYQRKQRLDPEVKKVDAERARSRRATDPEKAREISSRSKAKARKEKPHLHRNQWLWWAYRMRPEEYDALLVKQNSTCFICFGDNGGKALVVDHDHSKPKGEGNRWLLCASCNLMIGAAREHPDYLRRAAMLLERYHGA